MTNDWQEHTVATIRSQNTIYTRSPAASPKREGIYEDAAGTAAEDTVDEALKDDDGDVPKQ